MRWLYSLLVTLALPFASAVVLWRGLRDRNYWRGWRERFGRGRSLAGSRRALWVHAVSVGEVQAAATLMSALGAAWPDMPLALTSATPAGRARARAACGDGVDVRYGPYDLPWCLRGTLRRLRPALLVIIETEIWPNLLYECARAGVPVLIASARLSARSAARLGGLRQLLQPALRPVSVAAQSEADARRFESLGVPAAQVQVCGNIKFDRTANPAMHAKGLALRARYAASRPMWVAGSTHAGEEQAALAAHLQLRAECGDALLVLAPRHRARFDTVAELLRRSGLRWQRFSAVVSGDMHLEENAVVLLDTLGDLESFYAAADLAFVGGSLVPAGGHNLLEPAALGVATLTGPNQGSVPEVARLLSASGAVQIVRNGTELSAVLVRLLADPAARGRMTTAALAVIAANRGALSHVLALVREQLARPATASPANR